MRLVSDLATRTSRLFWPAVVGVLALIVFPLVLVNVLHARLQRQNKSPSRSQVVSRDQARPTN